MDIEIKLNYNREYFEELYFQNNKGNYIKSSITWNSFYQMTVSAIIFVVVLIYTSYQKVFRAAILLAGIVFIFFLISFCHDLYKLWQLKISVKKYLDELETEKNFRLILSEKSFSVISDKKKIIENWTNINKAEIKDNFTTLQTATQLYLFPKKSMDNSEFDTFNSIVQQKLK